MQLKKPAPRIRQLWERGVSQVQHRCLITHFNPLMSRCHLKTTSKSAKFETLNLFVFFFALARERVAIKLHSIESRCAIGPKNILFADASVPGNFKGCSSEGVKSYRVTAEGLDGHRLLWTQITWTVLTGWLYLINIRLFFPEINKITS